MRFLLGLCAGVAMAQGPDVGAILRERVAAGVMKEPAAGVINAKGEVATFGPAQAVYEIGSITKVFTAVLLADMVERGEVALADPVAKYLPKTVKVPERGGKQITLLDLATHKSGLPRLPANLQPKDMANPYADYTVADLYAFLSGYTLPRDIGAREEYSNLGMGLLGHALALRAGKDYVALVRERIMEPLGMKGEGPLVAGHDEALRPAKHWDLPVLAGAGALRSNVNDMLLFAGAACGFRKTKLDAAFARARGPVALAWQRNGEDVYWHNGGTGGFRSFLGCSVKSGAASVVLSNVSIGVDDVGLHLVEPGRFALNPVKKPVVVDGAVLAKYVGRYELTPGFTLTVTQEGGQLLAQATGQGKFELFAAGEREFFARVAPVEVTFAADGAQLTLKQSGRETVAKRIAAVLPSKEIALPAEALEAFVGKYELAPGFVLTVTREGNQLMVQATGQSKLPVYAQAPKEFFYKVVDAQITFTETGLVLHQNGRDMPAKRMQP
jgi:D-alanyl-D-alanine-carboxypeptidase/D-alanyl-D-alanine-endopeptidase